ncbi:MAG: NAD-glutamate dehydrogenase [Alphaproteobacteria bacterium]|nr:NAD-glutamate dehydrogenase [Alphaproteobacteria bacterium]
MILRIVCRPASGPQFGRPHHLLRRDIMVAAPLEKDPQGFSQFAQTFYAGSAPDDLKRFSQDALAGIARLFWRRLRERRPGQSFARVFDPTIEADGFTASCSFVATVNDDMPFLVDSVLAELADRGLAVKAIFHPIMRVKRDAAGSFRGIAASGEEGNAESMICVAFSRAGVVDNLPDIEAAVERVLSNVNAAVADWEAMLQRLDASIAELRSNRPPAAQDEIDESLAFLDWLKDNHFTFLGARDYALQKMNGSEQLTPLEDTGLGVLRSGERRIIRRGQDRAMLTPEVRGFLMQPSPLIITKSIERSNVHRRVQEDYIGIKRFDNAGQVVGERRFIGLFTSGAYNESPRQIPFLRRKVENVVRRSALPRSGHRAKALAQVLETFPRDELFQISEDDLLRIAPGIAYLSDRPRTKAFLRFDTFHRFASVLVYFPADKFRGGLVRTLASILVETLGGRLSAAYPHTEEGQLTRIHYIIDLDGGRKAFDEAALQTRLEKAVRLWSDDFSEALHAAMPTARAEALFAKYGRAFSEGYRETFSATEALGDIAKLEEIKEVGPGALTLRSLRGGNVHDGDVTFKIYHAGSLIELSDLLPVLEHFGVRVIEEINYPVKLSTQALTIHDLKLHGELSPERETAMRLFEEAFLAVWYGQAESDGFNRLTLYAELPWREVSILRTIAKYLRQAGFPFSQALIEEALSRNPRIASALVRLFKARLEPGVQNGEELQARISTEIDDALAKVPSLDDDRIIRRFRNVIESVLRTNFWQTADDGTPKAALSIKVDSHKVEDLPLPRPMVEIFVYSPEVEGVHLRFGKVARGGIRWSDRREDFRTEILGLVKAQQVKNAVIVPVGSKGGFYPKKLPAPSNREAWLAGGVAAYKVFISSLLDLTDNIAPGGKILPPKNVVRLDGDDPYLVVAADKGTATFSDIANSISLDYGFWLGDAFASGGSVGYDHKKMGITARGAWEAVKRHFREIGTDIQSAPFTVVGVGDMSGDVFGNGMLLSKFTKLVAAFDHRDIFLDPDPDIDVSFAERERIFNLPRSSWADYDQAKISKGGGVYSRSMKRIPLSPQVKALTGLTKKDAEPAELIRALLTAPVDLLWFGGIGTFVKASTQSNLDAGDKANDALRVDGREIRARVIGEGANLGVTQAGRIEYAFAGGRINTDAIDNSAGVDTSDHEVNLKILLNTAIGLGEFKADARDSFLAKLTDEVGALVLADNYNQTSALSVAQSLALGDRDAHARFMTALERDGRLNRAVEGLPSNETLRERGNRNQGLTRPELAVLLAYAKLQLFDEINHSELPDDPYYAATLKSYFPHAAAERCPKGLAGHRLRREIIGTMLDNDIVNRGGPLFIHRLKEASGLQTPALVRAYTIAIGTFEIARLTRSIDALDNKIAASMQIAMHARLIGYMTRQTLWFARHVPPTAPIGETIATFANGLKQLRGTFSTLVSKAEAQSIDDSMSELRTAGVPDDLADEIAALPAMGATPDIVRLALETNKPLDMVAGAYFAAARAIGVDRLRLAAERMSLPEHWDRLAVRRLINDLFVHQRTLAARALGNGTRGVDRAAGNVAVETWADAHRTQVDRVDTLISELERSGAFTVARLTLAASQIRDLLDA